MPDDYRDYLMRPYGRDPGEIRPYDVDPSPASARPDRALATTFLRGQFAEHQTDTPEQWAAWRDNLPFRWAQTLVDAWRAEQEPPHAG